MGNFLALSGVIGKTHNEVFTSLTNYANSIGGGIQEDNTLNSDNDNCCIIEEANGNTTIFYPAGYIEWDDSSEFISRELNAAVFSLHIHDGDLWMYLLYNNGKVVDQFNPIPDYWDENITEEEIESWRGNASVVTKYVCYIKPKDIENYLVRWNLDEEESAKAYPTDEFTKEEWQLVDFMTKLKLPYPLDDNGNPKGQTYKFWTEKLRLKPATKTTTNKTETKDKTWWKFW
jgi:hypothetical protein